MGLTAWLGYATALAGACALSNYVVKQVAREYVKKVQGRRPLFASAYRGFMRKVVRTHPVIGFACVALLSVHAGLAVTSGTISVTGMFAGVTTLATASLGAYGLYRVRRPAGAWIHFHRGSALVLAAAVAAHVSNKVHLFLS